MFKFGIGFIAFLLSLLITLPAATGIWFSPTPQNECYRQGAASLHSGENVHYTLFLLAEEIVELSKKESRLAASSLLQKSNDLQIVQSELKGYFNYLVVNSFTIHEDVYIQIRSLRL